MKMSTRITLRMPEDVARWVAEIAAFNCASQNSEIVRALREKMAAHRFASAGAGEVR